MNRTLEIGEPDLPDNRKAEQEQSAAGDRLERLLDEFLVRSQHDQSLTVERFASENPSHANQIRELFPAVLRLGLSLPAENPSPPSDFIPDRMADFRIVAEIGRGGMGVVYRAFDPKLNREIALKVLLAGEHADADELRRFREESEIVAKLRHPGIVQVYDIGSHDGHGYMALELVEGGNLLEHLAQPKPLKWSVAMVLQLARIVAFAHQKGIIHRDLKPENILMTAKPTDEIAVDDRWNPGFPIGIETETIPLVKVKISDFGLAKNLLSDSNLTSTGIVMGTPCYMAPEQAAAARQHIGPAADIYSLGVILFLLITGKLPFDADDVIDTLRLVQHEDPPPPRSIDPKIPRDLETVCLKCLRKHPMARYKSAEDLAADLERFLQGEPVLARRLSIAERMFVWARQQPLLSTLLVVATGFYCVHLYLMVVIQSPYHTGVFHWINTAFILITIGGAFSMQGLMYDEYWRQFVHNAIIVFACLFVIVSNAYGDGPSSIIMPVFFVAIGLTTLYATRPWVAWLVTGVSVGGYALVWSIAKWARPAFAVPVQNGVAFSVCLLAAGAIAHMAIRRVHTGDRGISRRTLPRRSVTH